MNWDDLKYLLALQQHGTLSAAARYLGVNQTTASRRLERLEGDLGVKLFDRVDHKLVMTPEGEHALSSIQQMEEAALTIEHNLKNRNLSLYGTVRVTSVPMFTANFIAPRIKEFYQQYPNIHIELVGADSDLNLSRREADLAIRFARPTTGNVLIKKLGEVGFAAYASSLHYSNAAQLALSDFRWAGYDESLQHFPEARWLSSNVNEKQLVATTTDVASLTALIQSGLVAAVLPCMTGDTHPDLIRLTGSTPICHREVWLLSHPDAKKIRRILFFSEWLQALVKDEYQRLNGY